MHLQIVNIGLDYPLSDLVGELNSRQSASTDHLVIVDNASTPETYAHVVRATLVFRGTTQVVELDSNAGFIGGHNCGLRHWDGRESVALVNPDLGEGLPSALDAIEAFLAQRDGLVGVPVNDVESGATRSAGRYNRWMGRLKFSAPVADGGAVTNCSEPLTCPSGALMGLGPKLLGSLHGQLPQLSFMFLEELVLAEVARSLGFSVAVLADPQVAHVGGTRRKRSMRRSAALVAAHFAFERWARQRDGDVFPRSGPMARLLRELAGQRMRDWPALLVGVRDESVLQDLSDAV